MLAGNVRTEVAPDHSVPGRIVLLVELLKQPTSKRTALQLKWPSFLMKAAMSFSMLYFSRALQIADGTGKLGTTRRV